MIYLKYIYNRKYGGIIILDFNLKYLIKNYKLI